MDTWHEQHKNDPNIKHARDQASKRYHNQGKTDPEYVARRKEYGRKWRAGHKTEALAARRQYYKDHPEYAWLDSIKSRAKKLNVPFNLTVSFLRSIMVDTCPVLGIPLISSAGGEGPTNNSPTVDRIIPSLGYVKGNVMVISKLANQIKSCATPEQITQVAEYYSALFADRLHLVAD